MLQSLQYVQPLFVEERRVMAWGKALMRITVGMFLFFAAVEIAISMLAWRRLNLGLRELNVGVCVLFLCLPFVLTQMRGITVLEPAALQLRLAIGGFSLWKRTIPLATVKDVEQAPFYSSRSVLKMSPGMTQFMTGVQNVLVKLDRGSIVIGSAQPDELLESLQRVVAKIAEGIATSHASEMQINSN